MIGILYMLQPVSHQLPTSRELEAYLHVPRIMINSFPRFAFVDSCYSKRLLTSNVHRIPHVVIYDGKRRGKIYSEVLQACLSDNFLRGEDFPSLVLSGCSMVPGYVRSHRCMHAY